MKNKGVISEINGKNARIQVLRESACGGNCASCSGCELKNHFVDADIEKEFDFVPKVGDKVEVIMDDKLFFKYAVVGYGVFVLFLLIGAVLGWTLTSDETVTLLCAALGLLVAFVIVKLLFGGKKNGIFVTKTEE